MNQSIEINEKVRTKKMFDVIAMKQISDISCNLANIQCNLAVAKTRLPGIFQGKLVVLRAL